MYIIIDGQKVEIEEGKPLLSIAPKPAVAAYVDGLLKEMAYIPTPDATVQWLYPHASETASRIYCAGLMHLLAHAMDELYSGDFVVHYYLASGLYCEINGVTIDKEVLNRIDNKMREFIATDTPFKRIEMSREAAQAYFEKTGRDDVARLLRYRKIAIFNVYENLGYRDYFYGYMPPSTGILNEFLLIKKDKGFILKYPTPYEPKINSKVELKKFSQTIRDTQEHSDIIGMSYVADLNDALKSGDLPELIQVCEVLHDRKMNQIADMIKKRPGIRLIKIAGPSSSGKTTFAKRLAIHLRVLGIRTLPIGMDDYFIDRELVQLNKFGIKDLENISTVNLQVLNEQIKNLVEGRSVQLCKYDFITGKNNFEDCQTRLKNDEIIILEGTHGLNDMVASNIPQSEIFSIFIMPVNTMNLDNHNTIVPEDIRLLRRLVRDRISRGHSFEQTLAMWVNVRHGEFDYILPYRERADIIFNSFLFYEPLVLKKYAYETLIGLNKNKRHSSYAIRIIKFLNYFLDINGEEKFIRSDSILREFIGDSCYYENK